MSHDSYHSGNNMTANNSNQWTGNKSFFLFIVFKWLGKTAAWKQWYPGDLVFKRKSQITIYKAEDKLTEPKEKKKERFAQLWKALMKWTLMA